MVNMPSSRRRGAATPSQRLYGSFECAADTTRAGIIDRSFGFMTAVSEATRAIEAARTEAESNRPNGIGVVKLMGRSAGFLAAFATLASQDVDLCLVPEVPIVLEDALPHLERVVDKKGHAVVVVAEGAGEELLGASAEKDAGGNKKLPPIGAWLTKQIKAYFKGADSVSESRPNAPKIEKESTHRHDSRKRPHTTHSNRVYAQARTARLL